MLIPRCLVGGSLKNVMASETQNLSIPMHFTQHHPSYGSSTTKRSCYNVWCLKHFKWCSQKPDQPSQWVSGAWANFHGDTNLTYLVAQQMSLKETKCHTMLQSCSDHPCWGVFSWNLWHLPESVSILCFKQNWTLQYLPTWVILLLLTRSWRLHANVAMCPRR